MNISQVKSSKRSISKKLSMKVIIFSLLGICIGVMLFSSTFQMSVIIDMSIRMKRNVTGGDIKLSSISRDTSVGNYSANTSNSPNKTDEKREDFTLGKNGNVDKFGNNINTNSNRRQPICSSCFQHNFNYVIQNDRICKLYLTSQTIHLIILITTTHEHINQRTALRSTWLSHTKNNTANVRYAFLLGEINDDKYKEAVLKENSVYHDLIKEDFVDTYMNLTYKTIMGFKWAATKCAHAHYVMKTDDDMFVNIPNVLKIFKRPYSELSQKAIVGACHQIANPIRDRKSKWFASVNSYPENVYPGFCSGTGYVTSMRVVNAIYIVSRSIPFFHLEDVYVSLCIRKLGFRLQSVPGFNIGRPKMDPCLYKGKTLITAHQLTPVMLQSIWRGQCARKPRQKLITIL